jgi:FkbM family methyltransferase
MWKTLKYYDEHGKKIHHLVKEKKEQELCETYITPECVVLELGARYGTASCAINKVLNVKTNHVAVEPDSRVWGALESNRTLNECSFFIHKGFVSEKQHRLENLEVDGGYSTSAVVCESSTILSNTLNEIEEKYNLKFNTLVADCEGFLETFFDQNPEFYKQIKLIIFEKDCPKVCDYKKIKQNLIAHGFAPLLGKRPSDGKPFFREVWKKS